MDADGFNEYEYCLAFVFVLFLLLLVLLLDAAGTSGNPGTCRFKKATGRLL